MANRAGSDGTNAWTANDRKYRVVGAVLNTDYCLYNRDGRADGFLKMLPIYIDHILHPTITDAGFVTEVGTLLCKVDSQVHHINGQGEDAGVVYSEMQAMGESGGRSHGATVSLVMQKD